MAKARRARATAKKKSPVKAKPKKKKAPPKPRRARKPKATPALELAAVPEEVVAASSTARRRALTARERLARSSPVVEILDDPHPIGALRRFLETIRGVATEQQAQIALGAAQLLLLSIARDDRGGADVKELVHLVLERWAELGARRTGYHGQEFLR